MLLECFFFSFLFLLILILFFSHTTGDKGSAQPPEVEFIRPNDLPHPRDPAMNDPPNGPIDYPPVGDPSQGRNKFLRILKSLIRGTIDRSLSHSRKIVLTETNDRPRVEVDVTKAIQNVRSSKQLISRAKNKIDARTMSNPLAKIAIGLAATALIKHHINLMTFAVMSNFAAKTFSPIVTGTSNNVNGGKSYHRPPDHLHHHSHHSLPFHSFGFPSLSAYNGCQEDNVLCHSQYPRTNEQLNTLNTKNHDSYDKEESIESSSISESNNKQSNYRQKIYFIHDPIDVEKFLHRLTSHQRLVNSSSTVSEKIVPLSHTIVSSQEIKVYGNVTNFDEKQLNSLASGNSSNDSVNNSTMYQMQQSQLLQLNDTQTVNEKQSQARSIELIKEANNSTDELIADGDKATDQQLKNASVYGLPTLNEAQKLNHQIELKKS